MFLLISNLALTYVDIHKTENGETTRHDVSNKTVDSIYGGKTVFCSLSF